MVLVSGGADSMTLLTALAELLPPSALVALHVNYGLREGADADQELVAGHCGALGVELRVRRAGRPAGNVQAWARDLRLEAAEELRRDRNLDWIAVGHTKSDQAETFLYRLASSPGARALLAMPARSGRIVRPLLGVDRRTVRQVAETSGVPFHDDPTNDAPVFARNRVRHEVVPALERINPGAEGHVVETRAELAEDEEFIASAADGVLAGAGPRGLAAAEAASLPPALLRRVVRRLAEDALGRPVPVSRDLAAEVRRLAGRPEGGRLDLGSGDSLVIEAGRIAVVSAGAKPPRAVELRPGANEFGRWSIHLDEVGAAEARAGFGDPLVAFLDVAEASDARPTARSRRGGDRISQLGMAGSKSLQDLFTDGRVPRSERAGWPVVTLDGKIVWVPGLAVSDEFLVGEGTDRVLRLRAAPPPAP